jgi:hypothetical protein
MNIGSRSSVERYQSFVEAYCFRLQGRIIVLAGEQYEYRKGYQRTECYTSKLTNSGHAQGTNERPEYRGCRNSKGRKLKKEKQREGNMKQ